MLNNPLVSIAVITYNSSQYVVEALDSIDNQNYDNIELIISDDGSSDGTIDVCRKWLEIHGDRFARTRLLAVPSNTGTSANYNRAEDECTGEWVMTIDGDDVLMENAIRTYIDYCQSDPSVEFIFSRIKAFGAPVEICEKYEKEIFSPSFFANNSQDQLEILLNKANHICSSTFFYNRDRREKLGVRNDERIPLLEDWPKWINLLQKGAKFSFIDQPLVKYRITNGVSTSEMSLPFYKSNRLFYFYYLCSDHLSDSVITRIVEHECSIFEELAAQKVVCVRICNSFSYKIGRCLLWPFRWSRRLIRNWV